MSMSTYVIGLRDMDGEFARMLEVKLFCDAHKVSYPKEVEEYFRGEAYRSEAHLREEFLEVDLGEAIAEWDDGRSRQGYEVDVKSLPPEVKTLRFYNSW